MQKTDKKNILFFSLFSLFCLITGGHLGKKSAESQNTESITTQLTSSNEQIKTYKKEFDSLRLEYSLLEKKKQEVKTIYLEGKKTIRYIDKERIELYEDSLCKKDVLTLQNQLSYSDSLLILQDEQLTSLQDQNLISLSITREKDKQLDLLKSKKAKNKPLGIGITGGYGTNFQNGFSPFLGIGISYNLIQL